MSKPHNRLHDLLVILLGNIQEFVYLNFQVKYTKIIKILQKIAYLLMDIWQ